MVGLVGAYWWLSLLAGFNGCYQWQVLMACIFSWYELLDYGWQVGMFCFLREYWGGFFPILLVELTEGEEDAAAIEQRTVGCILVDLSPF